MEELTIIAEFPKGGAIAKRKNGEKVFVRNYFSNKLKSIFCNEKDIEKNEKGLNVSNWRSTKPLKKEEFDKLKKEELDTFIEIEANFMSKNVRYKKNIIRKFLLDLPLGYEKEDVEEFLPENSSLYKTDDGWILRTCIENGSEEENHLLKEFHEIELLAEGNFMKNFGPYFSRELENAIKENNLKNFVDSKRELVESYIRDRNSLKQDLLKKIKESQNVNFVSSFIS